MEGGEAGEATNHRGPACQAQEAQPAAGGGEVPGKVRAGEERLQRPRARPKEMW